MRVALCTVLALALATFAQDKSQVKPQDKPQEKSAETIPESPYFPLKKDALWIYKVGNQDRYEKVAGFKKVGETLCDQIDVQIKKSFSGKSTGNNTANDLTDIQQKWDTK